MPTKKRTRSTKRRTKVTTRRAKTVSRSLHLVVALIFCIIFLIGLLGYRTLTKRYTSAFSPATCDLADREIYTLLYMSLPDINADPVLLDRVSLVTIDIRDQIITFHEIPVTLELDIPGKFGVESVSKIWALGSLMGEEGSAELAQMSIQKLLGVTVDRYILISGTAAEKLEAWLANGSSSLFLQLDLLQNLPGSFKTNTTLAELSTIISLARELEKKQYTFYDASDFDEFLREQTFNSAIAAEKKSVAILNGTDIAGMAAFGGRVVENIGGRSIALGNTVEIYDESTLVVDDPSSETVAYLARFFGITNIIHKKDALNLLESVVDRADITLILGFDISGKL